MADFNLKEVGLFGGLSDEDSAHVAALMTSQRYDKGDELLRLPTRAMPCT